MSYCTSGRWDGEKAKRLQSATVALVVLAVVGMILLAGCAPQRAVDHALDNAANSRAIASDTSYTEAQRQAGEVNMVSWEVQVFLLTGDHPSPEVIQQLTPEQLAELGIAPVTSQQ